MVEDYVKEGTSDTGARDGVTRTETEETSQNRGTHEDSKSHGPEAGRPGGTLTWGSGRQWEGWWTDGRLPGLVRFEEEGTGRLRTRGGRGWK